MTLAELYLYLGKALKTGEISFDTPIAVAWEGQLIPVTQEHIYKYVHLDKVYLLIDADIVSN